MRPPKFLGVYSQPYGKGSFKRKMFFFAWNLDGQDYAVQPIDQASQPAGAPRRVSSQRFAENYRFEPSMLAAPVSRLDPAALDNPQSRRKAVPLSEEAQEHSALAREEAAKEEERVEASLRENFRKAMLRLKRPRDREAAIATLEQLAVTTEHIVPAHKHMFRDFGAALRKGSMLELALRFSARVVELAPEDDHAHFNMARILYSLGALDEAVQHLRTAIELDASEPVYVRMLAHIQRQKQRDAGFGR